MVCDGSIYQHDNGRDSVSRSYYFMTSVKIQIRVESEERVGRGEGEARWGEGEARWGEGEARWGEGEVRGGEGEARLREGEATWGDGEARSNCIWIILDCILDVACQVQYVSGLHKYSLLSWLTSIFNRCPLNARCCSCCYWVASFHLKVRYSVGRVNSLNAGQSMGKSHLPSHEEEHGCPARSGLERACLPYCCCSVCVVFRLQFNLNAFLLIVLVTKLLAI